jgi:hypothetical protein
MNAAATKKPTTRTWNKKTGILSINGTPYAVKRIDSDIGGQAVAVFKLSPDFSKIISRYDVLVASGDDGCTCGDSTYRQRRCKHYEAVAELIRRDMI